MGRLNFNVSICKEFDETTKSVKEFINQLEMENNKAEITFFSMISGYGEAAKEMQFDYYLVCVQPEDEDYRGKGSLLFTMTMRTINKSDNEVGENGDEKLCSLMKGEVFQEIAAYKRTVNFPCAGCYELRVYNVLEDCKDLEPKKRIKKYKEVNNNPISTCVFYVKNPIIL